jgi:hypothetical protein
MMMFDYLSVIFQIMLFSLVTFTAVLAISLRIIKKKEQAKRYKKHQTELEEILRF